MCFVVVLCDVGDVLSGFVCVFDMACVMCCLMCGLFLNSVYLRVLCRCFVWCCCSAVLCCVCF